MPVLAAGALCLVASPAMSQDASDYTKDEQKCEGAMGKALGKEVQCISKCVSKCLKAQRKAVSPDYSSCLSLSPTDPCIVAPGGDSRAPKAKAEVAIGKKCDPALGKDCPFCFPNSSVPSGPISCSTGQPMPNRTQGLTLATGLSFYCVEAGATTPTPEEAKCEDTAVKEAIKFVDVAQQVHRQVHEGHQKGTIAATDCAPANGAPGTTPNDPDAQACIAKALTKMQDKVNGVCVGAANPSCYPGQTRAAASGTWSSASSRTRASTSTAATDPRSDGGGPAQPAPVARLDRRTSQTSVEGRRAGLAAAGRVRRGARRRVRTRRAPPLPGETLPGAAPFDAPTLARLRAAWEARPAGYTPRTRHLLPDGAPRYTNRLFLESSPYLLQHAHNPVDWYPWGDEAFDTARRLGRPVLLSVGYSTCHWCHVMEEESFEDEEIARCLNEHYVAIKVDREERPDVDAVYMSAVQALTGSGGWPMTVWLTPDRQPFFGGTYFPPRDGDRGVARGLPHAAADARATRTRAARRASPTAAASLADAGRGATSRRRAPATTLARTRRVLDARRPTPAATRSTRRTAALAARRSSRARPAAALPAPLSPPHRRRRRARAWRRARSSRWRRAASTTTWAAASTATRPTRAGSCRTSRRCSTTTRSSRSPTSRRYQATGRDRLRRRRARDPRLRRRAT